MKHKAKIHLGKIAELARNLVLDWSEQFNNDGEDGNEIYHAIMDKKIDRVDTIRVLKKFYSFYWTPSSGHRRGLILATNSGNIIEYAENGGGVLINGREQCLGEDKDSWAFALGQIKTTSDFLAQLAVFCNKHAK